MNTCNGIVVIHYITCYNTTAEKTGIMHSARYEKPLLIYLKWKPIPFQSSGARPQGRATPRQPYHNKATKKMEESM